MKKSCLILCAVIFSLVLSGCTHRLTDFTVISTKNVPIGEGATANFQKDQHRVKGKDTAHWVLFFPIGMPNMKEAIDRAIESTPGAIGLVDGVVKSSSWHCLLYGQNKYIVEGTPIFASTNYVNNNPIDYQNNIGYHNNMEMQNSSSLQQSTNKIQNRKRHNNGSKESGVIVVNHNVKNGEYIVDIAKAYGVKVSDIIKWNDLKNGDLVSGQTLVILYKE